MKRRWWIDDASNYFPNGHVCGQALYVWLRTPVVPGSMNQLIGCVCHHSWTQRVRSFVEVPDA